ncbi:MAG: ribose 5-phosphate isomerase A [Candidatus Korarchaeota archaeon]|nr:ribose 5-phosphate isomerase A [Candidatus Korarchaeota archaeon]NIU83811.1 ribose 5-phosphate isomerase A [Candidatus Thorarchaeota archaeon]NIW15225.1 ribose 5-phosphate isomerase A [Candidatus Thorarchaeota archaeon]NIW53202.1 ribose 5-phosphate isomerase A [Candidatus Korarchaeota archaeon]
MNKRAKKTELEKKAVAREALRYVHDNMTIGIGSGTTMTYFINYIGASLETGELQGLRGVPSSLSAKNLLLKKCIPVETLGTLKEGKIDVAVDGLDSFLQKQKVVIKGRGGAFLQEKIIDYTADGLILIGDARKVNQRVPVPIEVLPPAVATVKLQLEKFGGELMVRNAEKKLGPVISDNGNVICDVEFPTEQIRPELEGKLNAIPGLLETGIFTKDAKILIGYERGEKIEEHTMNI